MHNKQTLTPAELSEYLNISIDTLWRWRRRGTGPAWFRAGSQIRYRLQDVQAYQSSQTNLYAKREASK